MPFQESFTIRSQDVNRYSLDALGLKDEVNNRFFTPYDSRSLGINVNSVDTFIWGVHEGIWQIAGALEGHTVVGGASAAVQIVVCPQGVAIASGVPQLSAAFDLTITAPVVRFGTLIASPTRMTRGDLVAVDFTGTLTGLVGMVDILFKRVG
jgi:hypothetical protein